MPDLITATASDSKFTPHTEGQFVALCVDMIDLGEKVEEYPGTPTKLSHKCALVFRTGDTNEATGELIDIAAEFTVSMGEKANLRKFLESWRGKSYKIEEVALGVPLHKLVGNPALVTIEHKTSQKGRTYAKIASVASVPKQMKDHVPTFDAYQRAEYWQEKKDTYAAEARKFKADIGMSSTSAGGFDAEPPKSPSDDLPF